MTTTPPTPIAVVLGANCRRIRTRPPGVKQDELARAARQFGLKWTASKVRDFEAGRTAPTIATVLALTAALDSVTKGEPGVRLADLVSFDGDVAVTEDFSPASDKLADYCSGGTWEHCGQADQFLRLGTAWRQASGLAEERGTGPVLDWRRLSGLTEERIAARLGISTEALCAESLRLWNTTLSDQRDRIAGPDANAQRKGQVTRQLKAELEKVISDGND